MIKRGKNNPSANQLAKEVRSIIDGWKGGKILIDEARKRVNTIMDDPDLHLKIIRGEMGTGTYTGTFKSVMRENRLKDFEELMK